jgi:flavin reductase (DIM6/NTAB) family NADH-FMN oxidoreductase RutF
MKVNMNWNEHVDLLKSALSADGVFLVAVDRDGKANPMTIGWGQIGIVWSRPVFTVLVRRSRYTHGCLLHSEDFTVNVPAVGELKEELLFCGTKSGRDVDKAKTLELTLTPSRDVSTPIIDACSFYYECRILARKQLEESDLFSPDVLSTYYGSDDHHMIVMGEIVAAYADEAL